MSEFKKQQFPPQHQDVQPGMEWQMRPTPVFERREGVGCGKLKNKVALITGGDSGIGRAVAVAFAQEGADVSIVYLNEHRDAEETKNAVLKYGGRCITIAGDIRDEEFCGECVEKTIKEFGRLNVLVNNAGVHYPKKGIEDITREQLENTFKVNVFSLFYMTKAAMPYLQEGASIINTTSITAYKGHKSLLDYSATKGAVVSFTRSLALNLVDKGIRVNGVAPGPIWTPLIPASFSEEEVVEFGGSSAMKRAGQPVEVAPCYVFLASEDSSYMTGQVLHPNGGSIVNG